METSHHRHGQANTIFNKETPELNKDNETNDEELIDTSM